MSNINNTKVQYGIFIHDALKAGLHIDLRMQYPNKNKLASWALPKAMFPEKTGISLLAVKTDDHDMKQLNKTNVNIPVGNYGAGKLKLEQRGHCIVHKWTDDTIIFEINDGKINGKFVLVKRKGKNKKSVNSKHLHALWYIFKID